MWEQQELPSWQQLCVQPSSSAAGASANAPCKPSHPRMSQVHLYKCCHPRLGLTSVPWMMAGVPAKAQAQVVPLYLAVVLRLPPSCRLRLQCLCPQVLPTKIPQPDRAQGLPHWQIRRHYCMAHRGAVQCLHQQPQQQQQGILQALKVGWHTAVLQPPQTPATHPLTPCSNVTLRALPPQPSRQQAHPEFLQCSPAPHTHPG